MTLKDYLAASRLSATDFAQKVGITRHYAARLARGERIPRTDLMRRIVDATEGAVTANDFFEARHGQAREAA